MDMFINQGASVEVKGMGQRERNDWDVLAKAGGHTGYTI